VNPRTVSPHRHKSALGRSWLTGVMTVNPHRAGRYPAALVGIVMMLLLLAVCQLFTTGSAQHTFGAGIDSPVAVQSSCGHDHPGDQSPAQAHQHSDAATPAATPRLRQLHDTVGVILSAVTAGPAQICPAAPETGAAALPTADPVRRGVLRV
jgi:hypothetical protein